MARPRSGSAGNNTAVGSYALYHNTTGDSNTALGVGAGSTTLSGDFTGSWNIYVGRDVGPASSGESNTIRIGNGNQGQTFIAGISSTTITGSPVYVDSDGQLGTAASSRRFKDDIADMGDASSALMRLRPVTFRYRPEYTHGPRSLQYGLIAEEVAEVYPDLVQYDPKTGEPQTVYYHLVNAMLLNEVQKQQKEIAALKEQNKGQEQRLSALEEQNKELSALKEQIKELSAMMVEKGREPNASLSRLEDRLIK